MQQMQTSPKQAQQRQNWPSLHARRTWLVSSGFPLFLAILIVIILVLVHAALVSIAQHLLVAIGLILAILLLSFCGALLFALATNRATVIKQYQKALRKYLGPGMKNYYAPETARPVQERLAAMLKKGASAGLQTPLIILGRAGSGKTENMKQAMLRGSSLLQSGGWQVIAPEPGDNLLLYWSTRSGCRKGRGRRNVDDRGSARPR